MERRREQGNSVERALVFTVWVMKDSGGRPASEWHNQVVF